MRTAATHGQETTPTGRGRHRSRRFQPFRGGLSGLRGALGPAAGRGQGGLGGRAPPPNPGFPARSPCPLPGRRGAPESSESSRSDVLPGGRPCKRVRLEGSRTGYFLAAPRLIFDQRPGRISNTILRRCRASSDGGGVHSAARVGFEGPHRILKMCGKLRARASAEAITGMAALVGKDPHAKRRATLRLARRARPPRKNPDALRRARAEEARPELPGTLKKIGLGVKSR